jgi:F0F1-type ATP synthase epsilon subunit
MPSNLDPIQLHVFVRSRSRTFFQGPALAVTSNNERGIFDILPLHANFISLIKDYIKITLPDKQTQKFDIEKGLLRVSNDQVDVYLEVDQKI